MRLIVVPPNDQSSFNFFKVFKLGGLPKMKNGFLLIMFFAFLLSSCKKEISEKPEDPIKPAEIVNWFKEYKQKMPEAPNPIYEGASKMFVDDKMVVRVSLVSGEGEMFFIKKKNEKEFASLFFRRVGKYDDISKCFTGFYEIIDMNTFVYKKIDFVNGIKVGEFRTKPLSIKKETVNGTIKSMSTVKNGCCDAFPEYSGSWLGALIYCLSKHLSLPFKNTYYGGWNCSGPETTNEDLQPGDSGGGGFNMDTYFPIIFPPHPIQPGGQLPSPPSIWDIYNFPPGGGLLPGTGGSNNLNEIIEKIKYTVPLSLADEQYLLNNEKVATELLEIIQNYADNEELAIGSKLALSVLENNSFNSEDILREYNVYHNQNYVDSDPISDAIIRYFILKFATLKAENDNLPVDQQKSEFKLLYLTFSDAIHTGLDLLGLVPIGGEIFDVINGFTYQLEGDKTNAYLSYASAIPVAGYAAAGVKAIKAGSVIIAVAGKKGFLVASRVSQSAFRKACGAVGTQVGHHIIPFHEVVQSHPLMQMAFKAGFDPNNAAINGKAIEAIRNSGNHTTYANKIVSRFDKSINTPPIGGWNPKSAKTEIENIIKEIKSAIDNQGGVHVDNLKF